MIRSGDTFMFESDSDEETESSDPLESVKGDDDYSDSPPDTTEKVNPFQVTHFLIVIFQQIMLV